MNNKTELSKNTLRVYESAYKNNNELFNNDINVTATNILNKNVTPSYKKTLLKAYIWKHDLSEDDKSKLGEYWKTLNTDEGKKYLNNTNNKNVPLWGNITYRYHKYVRTSKDKLKDRNTILAGLYIYMPPRRREYSQIRYYDKPSIRSKNRNNENYYIGSTGELVLNIYKTSKTYGTYKTKIHKILNAKIKEYVKKNKITNGKYLLNITDTQLYHVIHSVFGNDISVDILRRSYITNFYKNGAPVSDKIETLSKQMGHDVKTQLRYRTLQN